MSFQINFSAVNDCDIGALANIGKRGQAYVDECSKESSNLRQALYF